MKKSTPFLLLAFATVIAILPLLIFTTRAADTISFPVESGSIVLDPESGIITAVDKSVTTVNIPAEIDGIPITGIGAYAFSNCQSLTSVVISEGITSIGNYAFHCCESMTSIIIPESVTSIGTYAFADCQNLSSISIPDGVTYIGDAAFRNCKGLTSVVIPSNITIIESITFFDCKNLSNVVIPDSITSIRAGAFANCVSLSTIHIPDSVIEIEGGAFSNCSSLSDCVIPHGITSIQNGTFFNCSSLSKIVIPDSVTSIGERAFYGCKSLTEINIPDNVTEIGSHSFSYCTQLVDIKVPDGVTFIGDAAFLNCTNLKNITLPQQLNRIEDSLLTGCYNVTHVTIPSNVSVIGSYAFHGCTNLKYIVLPACINSILWDAFTSCDNLTDIYYAGTAEEWRFVSTFVPAGSLKTATVHYNSTGPDSIPIAPAVVNPFTDLKSGAYYVDSVLWAYQEGITAGTSDTTFSPEQGCTRAQVVSFLWRAAGSPKPTSTNNPFTDVKAGSYYYDAVLWAAEKGITAGTTATTFSPNARVTRGQFVTFLYRFAGSPDASGAKNPFNDLNTKAFYYNAVLWAVENGITAGTSTTTFSPEATCTRAQVVSFLYRYFN